MPIGKLSELVKKDYDSEAQVIKDIGSLWGGAFGLVIVLGGMWVSDFLSRNPWSRRQNVAGLITVAIVPFIQRAWERHKAAAQMRHEREIRLEVKVDALLGLVNIKDD